jgi:Na+/pantothenate symporter
VVALSDAVQGVVMLVSFICLPLVILKNFGGWHDFDPLTYGRPDFYQTPSADDQWINWQFSFVNICIFTLPHLIQRVYSAKDLSSLKVGFVVNCIGPWATSFVGVFIGTMGVVMGVARDVPHPFTAIIEQVMVLGGFAEVVGVIALTASLAAIMSTTDSLLIAISHLVTVEIIWPLYPTASQNQLVWAGRLTSLFSVMMGLIIGILWKGGVSALAGT